MSRMIFYFIIFVARGAVCFDSLCVHSVCPLGLHQGTAGSFATTQLSVLTLVPASLTGDSMPTLGPGPHPSFPLSHTTLAAEPGFGLAWPGWMPDAPPTTPLSLASPLGSGPRTGDLPRESRVPRGPPPMRLAPSRFTGPHYWTLTPTISRIRAEPGAALGTLCWLCPALLSLLPVSFQTPLPACTSSSLVPSGRNCRSYSVLF